MSRARAPALEDRQSGAWDFYELRPRLRIGQDEKRPLEIYVAPLGRKPLTLASSRQQGQSEEVRELRAVRVFLLEGFKRGKESSQLGLI